MRIKAQTFFPILSDYRPRAKSNRCCYYVSFTSEETEAQQSEET